MSGRTIATLSAMAEEISSASTISMTLSVSGSCTPGNSSLKLSRIRVTCSGRLECDIRLTESLASAGSGWPVRAIRS